MYISKYLHVSTVKKCSLSGRWFGTFFTFPYIGNVIIPTDELTFFRGVGQPPTSYIIPYHFISFRSVVKIPVSISLLSGYSCSSPLGLARCQVLQNQRLRGMRDLGVRRSARSQSFHELSGVENL